MTTRAKWLFLLLLGVLPLLGAVGTGEVAFHRAKTVEFCSSCHIMSDHVADLQNKDSDSLAAQHVRRGWIRETPCYSCHTDYEFLGPINAKIRGMRHLVANLRGTSGELKLYQPYPNKNCLACHASTPGYRDNEGHADLLAELERGETSCLECHEPAHNTVKEPQP